VTWPGGPVGNSLACRQMYGAWPLMGPGRGGPAAVFEPGVETEW
jgi:hypothetical protein